MAGLPLLEWDEKKLHFTSAMPGSALLRAYTLLRGMVKKGYGTNRQECLPSSEGNQMWGK